MILDRCWYLLDFQRPIWHERQVKIFQCTTNQQLRRSGSVSYNNH